MTQATQISTHSHLYKNKDLNMLCIFVLSNVNMTIFFSYVSKVYEKRVVDPIFVFNLYLAFQSLF